MRKTNDLASIAWALHNTLAFMSEALPEDGADGLPVKSTAFQLRDMALTLADGITCAEYDGGIKSEAAQ
jgi:hypothetical protein